jgi:AcrR family transcriptional regulator
MASSTRAPQEFSSQDSRFERRLSAILDCATAIFAEKGYEGASMRDLAKRTGTSLSGLYYYFESKEKLLYVIQQHTFSTIVERLRQQLETIHDPEARIRVFIHNHISYAVHKQDAMKVLSHEDDVLKDGFGTELAAIKREYYRICFGLVEDLMKADGLSAGQSHGDAVGVRTAVMALFGMMNWLYTWYKPRVDPDAAELARELGDILLRGLRGESGQDGAVAVAVPEAAPAGRKLSPVVARKKK